MPSPPHSRRTPGRAARPAAALFFVLLFPALFPALPGCRQPVPAFAPARGASAKGSGGSGAARAAAPAIGGQPPVTLERPATHGGLRPEFLSLTVLPGRGMNLFDITASIPGHGRVPVLVHPGLAEAAARLNGGPGDEFDNAGFSFGGAFLVPYPNRVRGRLSADGRAIITYWRGHPITLPANWRGSRPGAEPHAMHGLILGAAAENVKTVSSPDGRTLTATIHAGDFGERWFSRTDLDFTFSLAGDAIELAVTAHNVGPETEPIAIGWHPWFAIPSGERGQAVLALPATQVADVGGDYDNVFPTGKLLPVRGTRYDLTRGAALGDSFFDDCFTGLRRSEGNAAVTLADPAANYGLRLLAVVPEIRAFQVYAPPGRQRIAIEPQFNLGDPFGEQWKGTDTGMVTLAPGASVTWKVRLELFTPAG
jgi:galactose mutarotase-like enzyme